MISPNANPDWPLLAQSGPFRVLWTLEEALVPYELIVLPRTKHRGYHAINPLGTIPAFFDDGRRMTESSAICQYVAARYAPQTLAVAVDDPDYRAYLNFMHMGEATLTFPQTIFFRYSKLEPPERRNPAIADDYRLWFASRLKNAATFFEGKPYVCGDRFTAADISLGYALGFATHLGLAGHFPALIADYWKRLKTRDGFQRAREREIESHANRALRWLKSATSPLQFDMTSVEVLLRWPRDAGETLARTCRTGSISRSCGGQLLHFMQTHRIMLYHLGSGISRDQTCK